MTHGENGILNPRNGSGLDRERKGQRQTTKERERRSPEHATLVDNGDILPGIVQRPERDSMALATTVEYMDTQQSIAPARRELDTKATRAKGKARAKDGEKGTGKEV